LKNKNFLPIFLFLKGVEGDGKRNVSDKISEASAQGCKTVVLYFHSTLLQRKIRLKFGKLPWLLLHSARNVSLGRKSDHTQKPAFRRNTTKGGIPTECPDDGGNSILPSDTFLTECGCAFNQLSTVATTSFHSDAAYAINTQSR
jgi:hypothetical protein